MFMRNIKGFTKRKLKYIGIINTIFDDKELIENENITCEQVQEEQTTKTNCFALVVVRKLPWYKKLVRSIRNMIVIYRWRKAR